MRTDPTIPIWEDLYPVSVPELLADDDQHLEMFGTRVTGNKKYDEELRHRWRRVYCSIGDMVNYYRKGVSIRLSRGDTVKVYEAINTYLNLWKLKLETSLNIGDAPLEDLMDLDAFANSIYEHAKWVFDPKESSDPLYKAFKRVGIKQGANLFSYKPVTESTSKDEGITRINNDERPERKGDAEFFRRHLNGLGVFK